MKEKENHSVGKKIYGGVVQFGRMLHWGCFNHVWRKLCILWCKGKCWIEWFPQKKKHNVEVMVKTTIPPMNMWSRGQHHNTSPTNTNNATKKKWATNLTCAYGHTTTFPPFEPFNPPLSFSQQSYQSLLSHQIIAPRSIHIPLIPTLYPHNKSNNYHHYLSSISSQR